ncbi:MAG: YncE family protein [Bacteroidota bacterium]
MNSSKLNNSNLIIILLVTSLIFQSCKKDDQDVITPPTGSGVYVVNEGTFFSGNGELSFISGSNGSVANNIFQSVNGFAAGDIAQSFHIHQGKGYLVMNNSQKIEVVQIPGVTSVATITGFSGPRYMVTAGNKGYVTDWNSKSVKMVDLDQHAIISSIDVGLLPEQLLLSGDKLFVPNSGDSTVSIIDLNTWSMLATITVGQGPNSIQKDDHGRIWVLCSGSTGPDYIGGTADDLAGSLWRINANTFNTELVMPMGQFDHPLKLQTNASATTLYFLKGIDGYTGAIYSMNADDLTLPTSPNVSGSFYGLGIDPGNGNVWGAVAPSFTQNGYVLRYDLNGNRIDSVGVGIGPNGFAFN